MPTTSLDKVKSLINYLTVMGVKRSVILDKVGLTESELNQSNQMVKSCGYENLYLLAEQETGSKAIGFEFGQVVEPDRWGILGYIVYTAPTLKAALINQFRYQALSGNIGTPSQEYRQNTIVLKWLPAYRCSYHTVEEMITAWAVMARRLTNNEIRPLAVYFRHSCQTDLSLYRELFGCEVTFNSDYNGIEISQSILDSPLTKYNPGLYSLLCQQADNIVNNLVEKLPVEIVTQFISNQLSLGVPEIEDAAQNLQMSVRTLQRKLSQHQLTFSGLINTVRKDLAINYLENTDTKYIYIAQMLGFSEQSAFQRAFKRWTGKTPKQFRDNC